MLFQSEKAPIIVVAAPRRCNQIPVKSLCKARFSHTPQQNAEKAAAQSPVQRPSSGCASRSRTYDGGVKVPCLTAWRWRIMKNSIAYFPPFHKRCAAFLQLFFCVSPAAFAALFVGFRALRQGFLQFPYPAMFLRKLSFAGCVFQKIQPAGLKNSSCKGKIYFFLDFSCYFLQRLYFLLRFWYTGCDKNRLKKLLRRPGCARVGQCLHLCEGKRGIS